jgi:hypothetical protein
MGPYVYRPHGRDRTAHPVIIWLFNDAVLRSSVMYCGIKRDYHKQMEVDAVASFKANIEDDHESSQTQQPVMQPRFKLRTFHVEV